jgi:other hect domain ubiquitin protein ligase E3
LKGEDVVGVAGPYRQFFADISKELVSGSGVFCPAPNCVDQMVKDKYVITPSKNTA